MNTNAVAVQNGQSPRELALLKAVGLDRAQPEQRELAMNIAERYELDLLMKHLVLIDGRPYITRDGLLHVAHRSGQLDGIETTEPAIIDGFWRATASVYRKDMSHPFTYTGRYGTTGGNQKFAPEMAVKVAEVMALRRAFDVAAPAAEERWDVEVPTEPPAPKASLAERAAAKAAEVKPIADDAADADAARGGVVEEPTAEPSAPIIPWLGEPTGRLVFMEELARREIPLAAASVTCAELFPGIEPKALNDEQRGELLAELTKPA